jgi:hypothetical protein
LWEFLPVFCQVWLTTPLIWSDELTEATIPRIQVSNGT